MKKSLFLLILCMGLMLCLGCHRNRGRGITEDERDEVEIQHEVIDSIADSIRKAENDSIIKTVAEQAAKKKEERKTSDNYYSSGSSSSATSSYNSSRDIEDEDIGIYDDETGEHYSYGGEYDEDNIYDYENFAEDEGDF